MSDVTRREVLKGGLAVLAGSALAAKAAEAASPAHVTATTLSIDDLKRQAGFDPAGECLSMDLEDPQFPQAFEAFWDAGKAVNRYQKLRPYVNLSGGEGEERWHIIGSGGLLDAGGHIESCGYRDEPMVMRRHGWRLDFEHVTGDTKNVYRFFRDCCPCRAGRRAEITITSENGDTIRLFEGQVRADAPVPVCGSLGEFATYLLRWKSPVVWTPRMGFVSIDRVRLRSSPRIV